VFEKRKYPRFRSVEMAFWKRRFLSTGAMSAKW